MSYYSSLQATACLVVHQWRCLALVMDEETEDYPSLRGEGKEEMQVLFALFQEMRRESNVSGETGACCVHPRLLHHMMLSPVTVWCVCFS